eukprot:CAMPEP_0113480380 /NCGR_PEP_ID=MMETSP0014_2-20120614/21845_1 /TAXON_ID=2857 /ORGANISM="Nitzschia sp." /LENGTH=354 /DNA_ID=CAMNT_0000373807 /DNA_START=14 /DNA_END=1078 /DNA_ORIENTATION=- /assembly_acc=CAM_ASM_000159
MTRTRSAKSLAVPDILVSAGKNKKEAKSKAPGSNGKKGGGRKNKRKKNAAAKTAQSRKAASAANAFNDDDASSDSKISQPKTDSMIPEIPIVGRQNVFTESLWWMVDLEYDPVAEANSPGGTSSSVFPSTSSTNRQGATSLVKRCMRMYGWDLPTTRKILKGYRQFLHLKRHFEDWDATLLSPSDQVDKMWHAHILDINNYLHDCILLCGHVVGHNPDGMIDETAKASRIKTTRDALIDQFGPENFDETVWLTRQELKDKAYEHQDLTPDQNPDPPVRIIVKDQNGMATFFKIKRTTKMAKVFNAYYNLRDADIEPTQLRFLLDGEWIDPDDTSESLQLEDDDQIDVILEQCGC